jgi:proteasome lid subunit RPN8/RPN11
MVNNCLEVKEIHYPMIPSVATDLRYLAIAGYPFEVCGIIHEHGIIHQYRNVFCGNKEHGFDMEVDIDDPSIKAIWHSHPNGLAKPSEDDLPCMKLMVEHGFVFPWIIVTPKCVTAWQYLLI